MTSAQVSTAMVVAAGMLLGPVAGAGERLAARIARVCLQECGTPGQRLLRLLDHRCGKALLHAAQALTLPGIAAHYRWRKRRIRGWVRERTDAGVRQLIVLGAGFDALATELVPEIQRLRAIEIDLAGQQQVKRRALERLGLAHPRLQLVAADLAARSAVGSLARADGFDPEAPSVVVAEGVLMYLPPAAVRELFERLGALLSTPATVVATAMEADAGGAPAFRRQRPWVRRWLRRRDESFRWGCERGALPAALLGYGLEVDSIADPGWPGDPDPCPGEWLFRARLPPTRRCRAR